MTIAIVVLAAALAAVVVAHVLIVVRRATPAPRLTGKTVLVSTDEQTVRGVVVADHSDRITLRDALHVTATVEHPIGGVMHFERARIASIQEPEA